MVKGSKHYKELEEKPLAGLSSLDSEMDGKDKEKSTKRMSEKICPDSMAIEQNSPGNKETSVVNNILVIRNGSFVPSLGIKMYWVKV